MSGLAGALTEGLLGPVLVPAHALGLVALGLFIGQQRERGVTVIVFAAALVGGLIAIMLAVGETTARNVLLADAALLGVLVATAWAPPRPFGWLLAGIAGAALALDSPPQATTIAEAHATLIGTALGACAVVLAIAACAGHAKERRQRLGLRILGSWIAASAFLVLAVLLK